MFDRPEAAEVVAEPVDDLPPATMIRSVRRDGGKIIVSGVTTDNGEIASVTVNGKPAKFMTSAPGVVDWTIAIGVPDWYAANNGYWRKTVLSLSVAIDPACASLFRKWIISMPTYPAPAKLSE